MKPMLLQARGFNDNGANTYDYSPMIRTTTAKKSLLSLMVKRHLWRLRLVIVAYKEHFMRGKKFGQYDWISGSQDSTVLLFS